MKKLLKFNVLVLSLIFLGQETMAQCELIDQVPPPSPISGQVFDSRHGIWIPTSGDFRILLVLCEVEYLLGGATDPTGPSGFPNWPAHSLPDWADLSVGPNKIFDATVLNPAVGLISQYFQMASSNNLNITADILLAPTNGGVWSIQSATGDVDADDIKASITSTVGANLNCLHRHNDILDYDNYTLNTTLQGAPKPATSDTDIDHVMFIWRNTRDDLGRTVNGAGFGRWGISMLGRTATTYTNFAIYGSLNTQIVRHEFAHFLLGGNKFHVSGGLRDDYANYWIPVTSAYGALNLTDGTLKSWSGWDRYRMGWKSPGSSPVFNIIAHDASNTSEVNGDLDATIPSDAGVYTLRDFVSSGDAIRIKLPFISSDEFNQWIWVENHNGRMVNNCYFDEYIYNNIPCAQSKTPGLNAYMQIDKEIRSSGIYDDVYGGYADYLRTLSADGFHDRYLDNTLQPYSCMGNNNYSFQKSLSNPLTGAGDNDQIFREITINSFIDGTECYPNNIENISGTFISNMYQNGTNRQNFTIGGNNKIGLGTNPSSSTLISCVGHNYSIGSAKNTLNSYLNGVSIEILNQVVGGEMTVRIRFDDVDIDNDVRWCGGSIIVNPITSANGYSVNVKSGNDILLDQGITPTKMDYPQIIAGKNVFSDHTKLYCKENSIINVESSSSIIIDNNSSIVLENNSIINLQSNSTLRVRRGGALVLKTGSQVNVADGARIIIENSGKLEYFQGAIIKLTGPNAELAIAGILDIKDDAVFTFSYDNNNPGFVRFNNTTLFPSRNILAGNNSSINFSGISSARKILAIDQETFYGPASLLNFSISNGRVEFNTGSRLQADGLSTNINFSNTRFTSNTPGSNNAHRGVYLYGQPNVTIDNCIFEYGRQGIYGWLSYGGAPLTITNSIFRHNTRGIRTFDKGLNLLNCYYYNNDVGVMSLRMSFPSYFYGGMIGGSVTSKNVVGINWSSYGTGSLSLEDPFVNTNDYGVIMYSAPVYVKCGSVSYNNYGLYMMPHSSLFMDDQPAPLCTLNTSSVTAINNNYTIKTSWANYLYLNKGLNDLSPSGLNSNSTVYGTIQGRGLFPIPANQNQWNAFGGLNPTDYSLTSINQLNVDLDDASPLSSSDPCGQGALLCPNPPCDIESPLENCPTCDEINTDDFVNIPLNEATKMAMELFFANAPDNYRKAVDLFYQILMEDYINPGSKEVYLFNLNYTKMMEALGFAFSTGQISSTENESTLCEEVEKVIEVQTNMIENSVFSEFYSRKFGYAMDKAQTYRIAGRRDLCLDELNSIAGWVESEEDEADVQSFQCMVSLEKDFIEGTVPFDSGDIDEFMTACENSSANQRVRRETVLNKQESQIQTLKMEVILSPVPAKNLLNIITNVENGNIVMTNAFGQVVNKMPINYGITFDVSTLSRGIYFLTFADEISFERKVLRVILQ